MRHRHSGFDEINDIGTIHFNGCGPIDAEGAIEITVADAWDDSTPRRRILLTCRGAVAGIEYSMDVDKAEALGLLLCSAAREMRDLAESIDKEFDNE